MLAFAETDAHAAMVTELTGELPALRRVLHIDGSGPKALDQLVEAGASVDPAELTARRRGAARRRPGDAHLHLGHHRTTQGLPTHPFQPALRDPGRQGVPADAAGTRGSGCWSSCRWPTCWPRSLTLSAFANKVTVGFTSDIKNLLPMFAVFKPTVVVSVPRVFEKVYNTAEQNAANDGKGRIFATAVQTAVDWSQALRPRAARAAAARQACVVRPAGLPQAARGAGRRLPRVGLGWRTAGRAAGPLLPRRGPDHPRGLRPDRDQLGHHGQPGRQRQDRHRRNVVAGQQHAHRRRRRAVWCAAAWCSAATGATSRPPTRRSPTAGSRPAISARSTRTAS